LKIPLLNPYPNSAEAIFSLVNNGFTICWLPVALPSLVLIKGSLPVAVAKESYKQS
jgi:hypothetical protein